VPLRTLLASHKELAPKLKELEERISKHDSDIQTIVRAIRELMEPPDKPRRQIGFRVEERRVAYRVRRRR
jgi:hypothetical protein